MKKRVIISDYLEEETSSFLVILHYTNKILWSMFLK